MRLAALYFHPDEQVARAGVELAKADLRVARQWPNPRLQFGLKYQATQAAAVASPWTLGAAIGLLLWSHAQRQAQQQRAAAALRAAQAMLRASAWDVRGRVDGAFVDCWLAARDVVLQRRIERLERLRLRLLTAREQQGWASPWQVEMQRRALQRQQRALLAARATADAARLGLAAAVGVPGAALRAQALDFSGFDNPAPRRFALPAASLTQTALRQRADVLAAWQRVRQARAELQRQISLRDGAPARVAPGVERDQGANDLTLAANVPLPLFQHHEGQIDAARARQALAQARLRRVQAVVASQIEQARAALRAANRARRLARAQWTRARHAWLGADTPRARAWIDPLQLAVVQQQWLLAQRDMLGARARQWQALARLDDALQAPGEDGVAASGMAQPGASS